MPGDFQEFFDPKTLTDEQRGQIEFVLTSPAYEHSFKPYIQGILNSMNNLWKDRSLERRNKYNDDFLAGGACFGEGILKFFQMLVMESSMERIHEAMSRVTNEQLYDARRERGEVRPVVGLDQDALPQPVPPEEDY